MLNKAGLDPRASIESIGGRAAASWSLNISAPARAQGDFCAGFVLKHFPQGQRMRRWSPASAMHLDLPACIRRRNFYYLGRPRAAWEDTARRRCSSFTRAQG